MENFLKPPALGINLDLFREKSNVLVHLPKGTDLGNLSERKCRIRTEGKQVILDFCGGEEVYQIWKLIDCMVKENSIIVKIEPEPQIMEIALNLDWKEING